MYFTYCTSAYSSSARFSMKKMEGWFWVTVLAIVCSVVTMIFKDLRRGWSTQRTAMKWPPGPWKLPIIGNLHQLSNGGELVYVVLSKLVGKYGGIMTVWFGSSEPTIVVSDPELVWEVLVKNSSNFSSRTLPYIAKIVSEDGQTVSTSDLGSYWYKLRNGLQSTTLSPKNISENTQVQEENVSDMLSSIRNEASSNNGIVKLIPHLRRNTVKLIASFCFGRQFKDDNFVRSIDDAISELMALTGYFQLSDGFEFSRYIPGLNRPFLRLDKVRHTIEELIFPYVSVHKLYAPPFSDDCYVQFLLSENLSEKLIISNVFELFVLAVDSVSTTTAWALAFLIHNPKAQQKLFEEVSRETGSGMVKVENLKTMKYCYAVVKETMRMKPIAPLAVPHKAARDTTLAGTKILAGTSVMVNLYRLLHDPSVWVEPHQFMPDRFLPTSVITNKMDKSFLPFGAGRRACAGKELAKLQVAFSLATLVKTYSWSTVDENRFPDMSEKLTFVMTMKEPLVARVSPRLSSPTPT